MTNIENLLIQDNCTLRDALTLMDKGSRGVLLLVDARQHFLRTITDGDLRRLLLSGIRLEQDLSCLDEKESVFVSATVTDAEAFSLMQQHQINHLPELNNDGVPIGLITRQEIDSKIYLSSPHMGEDELIFVEEAFDGNWIAPVGPNIDAFEKELAAYVGIEHAAAVISGTAALHLALNILGVKTGDTVFCSSLTFIASANPILYQGAEPIFIDSEASSWNMSPAALEKAFHSAEQTGKLPKAVIVVHIFGQSADMDRILEICQLYNVPVIEDAAEALGANYKGKHCGTMGDMGFYSFNGNKIITTSGGGMLVSNNLEYIEKARFLSTQGRDKAPYYEHSEVAYNYRLSNVLAGIGRGQLKVLEDRVQGRRRIFARYQQALQDLSCVSWMPEMAYGKSNRWLSVMLIDENCGVSVGAVIDYLKRKNIEARYVWKPMHKQPLFEGCQYFLAEDSVSDWLFERGICLPSGSNLTDAEQEKVIHLLQEILPG
jgi:dTDP-4-amino-4,6-dideoxygalactose transaminase